MNKVLKYIVIKTDPNTLHVEALATFYNNEMATFFLNDYVEKNYILNNSRKCFHEKNRVVAIYDYFYLFSKQLVCKLQVLEYDDGIL